MRFICFLPQAAVPEWDRLVDPDSARMTVLCLEHREKQRPIDGWGGIHLASKTGHF